MWKSKVSKTKCGARSSASPFAAHTSAKSSTPSSLPAGIRCVRQTPSSIYRSISPAAIKPSPSPSKKLRFADQLVTTPADKRCPSVKLQPKIVKPVMTKSYSKWSSDVDHSKASPKTVALSPASRSNSPAPADRRTGHPKRRPLYASAEDVTDRSAAQQSLLKTAETTIEITTPNGIVKRSAVSLANSGDKVENSLTYSQPIERLSISDQSNSIAVNVNVAVGLDCDSSANRTARRFSRRLDDEFSDNHIGYSHLDDYENSITSALKVAVRLRPFMAREIDANQNEISVIEIRANTVCIVNADNEKYNKLEFDFDHCLNSLDRDLFDYADQDIVFRRMGDPLLNHTFEGYNVCLFAYGMTGSGKSYTMMGNEDVPGIIPRFALEMFRRIAAISDRDIRVDASYFEVYNERIRDLLCADSPNKAKPLRVREHPQTGPYIEDLTSVQVCSYADMMGLLMFGKKRRATASTAFNDESSRSHSIFTIVLTQTNKAKQFSSVDEDYLMDGEASRCTSKVNLVDLAGSERVGISGTTCDRLKEGSLINKSLLTLGKVITQLAEQGNAKMSTVYVPYRDSVLTWLLKESLGGNSRTSMIATISPAKCHLEETLSTLRYAAIARRVVNIVSINEDSKSKKIRDLMKEIAFLRQQQLLRTPPSPPQTNVALIQTDNIEDSGGGSQCDNHLDVVRTNLLEEQQRSLLEQIRRARETVSQFPELVAHDSRDSELVNEIYLLFQDVLNENSFMDDSSANDSTLVASLATGESALD